MDWNHALTPFVQHTETLGKGQYYRMDPVQKFQPNDKVIIIKRNYFKGLLASPLPNLQLYVPCNPDDRDFLGVDSLKPPGSFLNLKVKFLGNFFRYEEIGRPSIHERTHRGFSDHKRLDAICGPSQK